MTYSGGSRRGDWDAGRPERKDFEVLAMVKPPGYPFYGEAAGSWEPGPRGSLRYARRHEFGLFGVGVSQAWTLKTRADGEPPGALEQRLYETLEALRDGSGGGQEMGFDLGAFADHFLGTAAHDAQDAVLASLGRAFSAQLEYEVRLDGAVQFRGSSGWISGYSVEQRRDEDGRTTSVEVRFSDP